MKIMRVTLESDKKLSKRRQSDKILKDSADVGAVIGVVIRS